MLVVLGVAKRIVDPPEIRRLVMPMSLADLWSILVMDDFITCYIKTIGNGPPERAVKECWVVVRTCSANPIMILLNPRRRGDGSNV